MENDELERVRPLIYDLIRRETDPGEIHVCPNCNGKLHVSIVKVTSNEPLKIFPGEPVEKSIWDNYLAVGLRCENCKVQAFLHFTEDHIPQWAKESEYKDKSLDELWELLRKDSEEQ